MKSGECTYVWQATGWPNWRYELAQLAGPLEAVSRAQGLLIGRLADVGFDLRSQAQLATLTDDAVKSSEIEGKKLDAEAVRSSIARRAAMRAAKVGCSTKAAPAVAASPLDPGRRGTLIRQHRLGNR